MTISITKIDFSNQEEKTFILNECGKVFGNHMGISETASQDKKTNAVISYLKNKVNYDLSLKAIEEETNKIVGFYLLNDKLTTRQFQKFLPKFYKNLDKKVLEGVALVVLPEYQKQSIGKSLIDYTEILDFDFIFGLQVKSLNNLDFWQNMGRNLLRHNPELNMTGKLKDKILFENKKSPNKIKPVHMYQPDGISCGPTCIKMISNTYETGQLIDIPDMVWHAGVDNITGTTPDKLMSMLNMVGVIFRTPKIENRNMNYLLNEVLGNNNWGIIRTLTSGVKHWILAYDYNIENQSISVMDPWKGDISYSLNEFESIWKPRDYYFIEIVHLDNI